MRRSPWPVPGRRHRRALDLEVVRRAGSARTGRVGGVLRRVIRAQRVEPERVGGRRVRRRLAAERVGDVGRDDPATRVARSREVLLRHDHDVALRNARRADLPVERTRRVVDEVGLRLRDAVRTAFDASSGHEDRIPRPRTADRVRPRIAVTAVGRVAEEAAATARPRDAVLVHVDVVRVVRDPVVAPQVDRVREVDRLLRVAEVGDPDGSPVTAPAGGERPECGLVVAASRSHLSTRTCSRRCS